MHPGLRPAVLAFAFALVLASPVLADGPLIQVTGPSPLGPGCGGPQWGFNYFGTEVEPWLAINPVNPNHLVGAWQQDRWDNGGAQSLVAGVSLNGGASWNIVPIPGITKCTGGVYERASDPWVSFSPNGVLHQISLSFNSNDYSNAMLVSRSPDGGFTWSTPITLKLDTEPDAFNDKQSLTADPNDADYVYAVWDRLKVPPAERAGGRSVEHSASYTGATWFARTTDGGATWEEPRIIFDPGPLAQTIGNQILVMPSGELINLTNLIYQHKNSKKGRGMNVAVLRSEDRGETWSDPIIVDKLDAYGVIEPSWGWWVRSGDLIPEGAVNVSNGNLYLVWQDGRFTGREQIAFSMSTDGGFTWSAPIPISKSPAGVQAFTPSITVNALGTVGVTYYDFRNNVAHGGLVNGGTDRFMVTCDGDCSNPASWQERRVSPLTFNMHHAPWAGGLFLGDYMGLVARGPEFLSFFTIPVSPNQTDIFFRSMSPPPPIAAPIAAESGAVAAEAAGAPARLALAIDAVQPNPSANGRFAVQLTLPTSAPASLELIDVTGRRVAQQDLGSLGAGAHRVDLASGLRVPAGLYLLRLAQGGAMVTTRAAVIE